MAGRVQCRLLVPFDGEGIAERALRVIARLKPIRFSVSRRCGHAQG